MTAILVDDEIPGKGHCRANDPPRF